MRNVNGVLAAVLMTLLMIGGVTAQEAEDKETQTYDLSIDFEERRKTKYRMTETSSSTVKTQGNETESETITRYEFEQECTEIAGDGSATFTVTYTRVVLKTTANDTEMVDYDSDKDDLSDLDEGSKMKALLKDVKITATVSKDGEVSDLKGYETYKKKVADELGEMYAGTLEQVAGDTTMRHAMESAFRPLPNKRVSVGDSWKHEWSLPVKTIGTMLSKATYKLETIEEKNKRECAKLTVDGEVEWESDENAIVQFEMEDPEMNGTVWIDHETRETVYSEVSTSFTLVMNVGVEFASQSKVVTTMELLEDREDESSEDESSEDNGDSEDDEF